MGSSEKKSSFSRDCPERVLTPKSSALPLRHLSVMVCITEEVSTVTLSLPVPPKSKDCSMPGRAGSLVLYCIIIILYHTTVFGDTYTFTRGLFLKGGGHLKSRTKQKKGGPGGGPTLDPMLKGIHRGRGRGGGCMY